MQQHRHTVGIQVKPIDYGILQNVQNDKTLRVMVFACEADPGHHQRDIGFPYQSEIKVNGGEIKANLRGLKNKPGSTRPVDITDSLRLRQTAYTNSIDMTYALTQKAGTQVLQVSCQLLPSPFSNISQEKPPFHWRRAVIQAHANFSLQKFYMMIYVVRTVPVADLVKKLEGGKRITRESVISESKSN
jgi:E3 SUMO-protein ligase PIAS1